MSLRARLPVVAPIIALMAVAALFLAVPGEPAHAGVADEPPCYGPTCVGKSPYIVNAEGKSCASTAVDVYPTLFAVGDADIAVRWSSWCGANWVRWESIAGMYSPGTNEFYAQSYDGFLQYNSYGYYTPMVNGLEGVRGCVVYPYPGCTAYY